MFIYEKKLQYPVKIKNTNPALAKFIISQYGGPDGELGASLRYLSQRYSMPYPELKGLLTDIGTEELVDAEIVRLRKTEAVKLAQKEQRLLYRKRKYLADLRWLEKRGKTLMAEGWTLDTLELLFVDIPDEETDIRTNSD